MLKKVGRPKKIGSKNNGYRLRMSEDDLAMLDFVCEKTGESKADVLRKGLRSQYNLAKYL